MKKTISFNLEEDIIEKIEKYQKENRLSSRSAALERIILALDNKSNNVDLAEIVKNLMQQQVNINNTEEKTKTVEEVENKDLDETVEDIYGNME